jgi:hypothetical protein
MINAPSGDHAFRQVKEDPVRFIKLIPIVLALLPGLACAAEPPVDIFDRPVLPDSRLTAPAWARVPDTVARNLGGPPSAWRLLPFQTRPAGSDPRAIAVGHITGQHRPDVVIATSFLVDPETDYHLLLFRPEGGNSFQPFLKFPYGQTATSQPSIAVLDLDGEHGLDVVVGGFAGLTRFRSTQAGTLLSSAPESTRQALALATIDLDSDGWKDVVALSGPEGGVLHRNLGNGSFQTSLWHTGTQGGNTIAQGDLDGDGDDDVVVGSGAGGATGVFAYRNAGDGSLLPLAALSGVCPGYNNGEARGVGIGDVNGDGRADIVASGGGNSPTSCIRIFHGNGSGGFGAPVYLVSYDIPQTLRIADIDGDDRDDVAVAHGGWMALGVYLQQSDGSLAPERLFPLPYASHYHAHSFEIADLDVDGCADVALADYNNGLVTLKGAGCNTIFASGFE